MPLSRIGGPRAVPKTSLPTGWKNIQWTSRFEVQQRSRQDVIKTWADAPKTVAIQRSVADSEKNYYVRMEVYAPGITDKLPMKPSLPELKQAFTDLDLKVVAPGAAPNAVGGLQFRGKGGINNNNIVLEWQVLNPMFLSHAPAAGKVPIKFMAGSKELAAFELDVKP